MAYERVHPILRTGPSAAIQGHGLGRAIAARIIAQRLSPGGGGPFPGSGGGGPGGGAPGGITPPGIYRLPIIIPTPRTEVPMSGLGDPHHYLTPVIRKNNLGSVGDYFPTDYYLPSKSIASGNNFAVDPAFKQVAMLRMKRNLGRAIRARRGLRYLGDNGDGGGYDPYGGGGGSVDPTLDPCYVDPASCGVTDTASAPTNVLPGEISSILNAPVDTVPVDTVNPITGEPIVTSLPGNWVYDPNSGTFVPGPGGTTGSPGAGYAAYLAQQVAAAAGRASSGGGVPTGGSGGGASKPAGQQATCPPGFVMQANGTCFNPNTRQSVAATQGSSLTSLFTPQNLLIGAVVLFGGAAILKSI